GVSIGGGVLWTGEDQRQVTAPNQRQFDEYEETYLSRGRDMIDDHGGLFELAGDEEAMAEFADLPLQVAEEMGLPAMIINADGTSAFVEVDGSVGGEESGAGLNGSLRHEETRLLGTSEAIDADGNRVHGEYYAATNTDTAQIGMNVVPKPVLGGGLDLTYERVGGNVLHVEYDEDGDPMRVTAVNTSEWRIGRGGSLLLGFDGDSGSGGAGGGVQVEDGDVTVNTTSIEIPPDRRGEVADELRAMVDGDLNDRIQGRLAIAELADGPGATMTRQHYDAEGLTGRGGAELDLGIEWFDFGTSTSSRSMRLNEAHYRDPATGEWQRWYSCERSAVPGERANGGTSW
ncbi:hypothetical protein, partial [Actinomadura sp. 6K520]|uniref:hypothetical protein n=1 Tax=Actinomadura sp. 6K520 TaxID=2530364 RepID=UPI001A9D26B1